MPLWRSAAVHNRTVLAHDVEIDAQLASDPFGHSLHRRRSLSGHDDGKACVGAGTLLRHSTQQLPEHRVHVEADRSGASLRLCEDPLVILLSDNIDKPDLAANTPAKFVQVPAERLDDSLLITPHAHIVEVTSARTCRRPAGPYLDWCESSRDFSEAYFEGVNNRLIGWDHECVIVVGAGFQFVRTALIIESARLDLLPNHGYNPCGSL